MAGTTNHMQTHFVNGRINVEYTDDTSDTLELINPENWCPIEQDYFENGLAFKLNALAPTLCLTGTYKIPKFGNTSSNT